MNSKRAKLLRKLCEQQSNAQPVDIPTGVLYDRRGQGYVPLPSLRLDPTSPRGLYKRIKRHG